MIITCFSKILVEGNRQGGKGRESETDRHHYEEKWVGVGVGGLTVVRIAYSLNTDTLTAALWPF